MTRTLSVLLAALALAGAAQAQNSTIKVGPIRYTTHAVTSGIQGIGVPAGADATVGDSTTLIFVYEYQPAQMPNLGVELVLGVPPVIRGYGSGSVQYLGEILSTKNVSPTLFANYHFGSAGDTFRPYLGAGVNYTSFKNPKSKLAPEIRMTSSTGLALQMGLDYNINRDWGLFASIAKIKVSTDLMSVGSTVMTSSIDFRPITYQAGVLYRF